MWFRNIFSARSAAARERQGSAVAGGQGGPSSIVLSARTVRLLDRLQLNTGPLAPSAASGMRSSPQRRPAYEFREHRPYAPGDDVRYVDWKASARQERVFVKQGEEQKGAAVYVLIDCSASMGWGEPARSTAALALAHAIGYLALAHNDRLVVLPVSDAAGPALRPLGPLWGKGQTPMLESYLRAMRFQGRVNLAQTLASIPHRDISKGGLVMVISDLFGAAPLDPTIGSMRADDDQNADVFAGLGGLSPQSWRVVFCHLLHPSELDPRINGPLEMLDIETGRKKRYTIDAHALETYRSRMDAWQETLARRCAENRAVYCMLPTNASMEEEIIPRLRRERIAVPRR